MTAPPVFPSLPGQGWSVHKKPKWSTIIAPHVSGREVRFAHYEYPLWEFELTFDGLGSDSVSYPGLVRAIAAEPDGTVPAMPGAIRHVPLHDPTDNSVPGQIFATGDGSTTSFAFARVLGGFVEPVGWVTSVSQVTSAALRKVPGWSVVTPSSLVFTTAPASGALIGAYFGYAFECRFDDDPWTSSSSWKTSGRGEPQVPLGAHVMKTASTALIDFLNAARAAPDAPLAFAECFTFTLSTGTVLTWTNVDQPVVYNGIDIRRRRAAGAGAEIQGSVGLEVDKQQITIAARPTDLISGSPVLNAIARGRHWTARPCSATASSSARLAQALIGGVTLFHGRVSTVDIVGRTSAR